MFIALADYEEPTVELDMTATKDRRVIATDYVYTTPGWRSTQTAEDLARQLHPDAFG